MTSHIQLAAAESALGSVGAGGTALALFAILFFGIRKGGKQLPANAALVIAFIASVFSIAAGGIWAKPSEALGSVLAGITGAGGQLGDIGPGAIAIVITAAVWYSSLNAKWSAVWGYIAAIAYGAAGGLWAVPIEVIRTGFTAMGL